MRAGFFAICRWLLLFALASAATPPSEEQQVLQTCRSLFGDPVGSVPNVFEINQDYVLRFAFDRGGRLTSISVTPKYYLEQQEPEWHEYESAPFLSDSEFKSLLAKIGQIRSIGQLVEGDHIGFTSAGKTPFTDRYQHAYVRWESLGPESERGPPAVHAFEVFYLRTHSGTIENLKEPHALFERNVYRVKCDGAWYLVSKKQFQSLSVGRVSSFLAAGPFFTD
jgi:hypothetical protein